MRWSWSESSVPGYNGAPSINYPNKHPMDQTSIGLSYSIPSNNYGALYHLVDTYYVKGGIDLIYLANPKSHSFTTLSPIRMFYGFKSLWKNPPLCK